MSVFALPGWIKPHLYPGKKYADLTREEILHLQNQLAAYKPEQPDVSIMIPAWNEQDNIFRTLSSLSASRSKYSIEIVVINNNSTDNTQKVLDELGVRSFFQPEQGTSFARQMGLEKARGKYHLCADSDTFYPPDWVDLMVKPMDNSSNVVGVYGRYAFVPSAGDGRFLFFVYEKITGILVRLRKSKREHLNVLGFDMGFITETGRTTGGFNVKNVRKFDNAAGSDYFVDEAEDGRMALNLKTKGVLKLVTHPRAVVFTSSRRLKAEGGLVQSFVNRFKVHASRIGEYINGKKVTG
ncbi:Glycosyl transferase family 2 [Filimonas lacunae]|uniref:Glycosyl transferase family 2 n=1 Tax=Filimonas lacunae TaxID=477680 RepID=A0A173MRE7_9BACT|nr:glycosyltransferase family A protein [Filimonas lacunae]BAV10234.1 glycosyltransferase [Filimonas lacunae]SIT17985.1 Glycosyl transferase family 2 [Filimonas lacunae]